MLRSLPQPCQPSSVRAESASASRFSRPAQRSLALRPAHSQSGKSTLYTRGFSRFVASTTAPVATGRSESCRVGLTGEKSFSGSYPRFGIVTALPPWVALVHTSTVYPSGVAPATSRGDCATCARSILDDNRLPKSPGQGLGEKPSYDVGGTSGSAANDQLDWSDRVILSRFDANRPSHCAREKTHCARAIQRHIVVDPAHLDLLRGVGPHVETVTIARKLLTAYRPATESLLFRELTR